MSVQPAARYHRRFRVNLPSNSPVTSRLLYCLFIGGCLVLLANGATDSSRDADRILNKSPWAQSASAQFDLAADDEVPPPPPPAAAAAGLAGSGVQGAPRWDGEPGRVDRSGTPILNVLVRWDSAAPVRLALKAIGESAPDDQQVAKDYVVTIIGLVPANRYRTAGTAPSTSSSDDAQDPSNPEPMLEALMTNSSLQVGNRALHPENVKVEHDGALHFYFPRTAAIGLSDKDVTVRVRFGGMSVIKRFRLKEMRYQGGLAL